MPVSELDWRMSAHELCVEWPEFFAYRERVAKRQAATEEAKANRVMGKGRP